ncbi:hypothetical protein CR513_62282, partial [Mucuna pruriens]
MINGTPVATTNVVNVSAQINNISILNVMNFKVWKEIMSNLAAKLKSLKLELSEDLIVHLVLISLSKHFGQFKVSYNTQKDKWSFNEFVSHCVQEEEML